MCGIWAIFGSQVCLSEECANFFKIGHRGPDSFCVENIPNYPNCALGFHRLAIVDKLHGMQPQRLHSLPHLKMCYNGELYNCKVVKDQFQFDYETCMDGEAALHLYNRGGIEFMAQNLDGVFAMCLVDMQLKRVHLVRDTFGVRSLYRMLTSDGSLAVSSEAKGLVGIQPPKGKTANQIDNFPPGCYETYELLDNGKVRLLRSKRYHEVGRLPTYKTLVGDLDNGDMLANIRAVFKGAVKKRLLSDRRIGCLLSGGLDSSLVAALVSETAKEEGIPYQIQTFTTGMEGSPDIAAARQMATHIGSEHHEISMSHEDAIDILDDAIYHLESYDTSVIRGGLVMYLTARYIRKNTDTVVVFSGEGSDEIAQGYFYFHKAPSAEAGHQESLRLCQDLYMFDVLRADTSFSAHGLELRVPYLDHQYSAYYMSLPAHLRPPRQGMEKYLLRQAFDGTGLLPDEILWRHKESFSDGVSAEEKETMIDMLKEHADRQVTKDDMASAEETFPFNPPKNKEAYLYRKIFEKHFPGRAEWVPYHWGPRWSETADPSARLLNYYTSGEAQHVKNICKQQEA